MASVKKTLGRAASKAAIGFSGFLGISQQDAPMDEEPYWMDDSFWDGAELDIVPTAPPLDEDDETLKMEDEEAPPPYVPPTTEDDDELPPYQVPISPSVVSDQPGITRGMFRLISFLFEII